jgi:hypothetical protein
LSFFWLDDNAMTLPAKNSEYATQSYWDERYNSGDALYDWFNLTWPELQTYLSRFLSLESKILMLGCGNSVLSSQMFEQGYSSIVNLDFSAPLCESMRKMQPEMQCMPRCDGVGPSEARAGVVGDVRELPFEDQSFDVCLDKGRPSSRPD